MKMCGNVPHCLMAVSVQGFAEAAQRAVGVRADSNAVKMCAQTVMSNVQSKFCNCLLGFKVDPPPSGAPWATFYKAN